MVKVVVAHNAKYNPDYNRNTKKIYDTIMNFIPILMSEFDIGDMVEEILIRPIRSSRGSKIHGQAIQRFGKVRIEIDCRSNDIYRIIDTLAHEFTHAEQYNLGKLRTESEVLINKNGRLSRKGYYHWTMNGKISTYDAQRIFSNYDEYFSAPWEVEARERAAKFVEKYTLKGI